MLAGNSHREIHRRVYCTGNMIGSRCIPGRRRPGISNVYLDAADTVKIGRTLLRFLLSVLPDNQDVKSAIVGIIHKGDGTPLFNSNRGSTKRGTLRLDRIRVVARSTCCICADLLETTFAARRN